MEAARNDVSKTAAAKGWSADKILNIIDSRSDFIIGDPDTIGESLEKLAALGLDGVTMDLPANAHLPERIALLGATADRAFPPPASQ